jgi:hypothetical protein
MIPQTRYTPADHHLYVVVVQDLHQLLSLSADQLAFRAGDRVTAASALRDLPFDHNAVTVQVVSVCIINRKVAQSELDRARWLIVPNERLQALA